MKTDLTRRQMIVGITKTIGPCACIVGVSTVLLQGCATGTMTQAVDAIVVAAELALNIVAATGTIPPNIMMLVSPYLVAVGQAVIDTNTELQSMDTDAVKATKVAAIWATLAQGIQWPSGTPALVVSIIAQVVAAIKSLLLIIGQAQMALPQAGLSAGSRYQLTRGDRHVLGGLVKRAMVIKTKAQGLK
jgi:hypothetical protein